MHARDLPIFATKASPTLYLPDPSYLEQAMTLVEFVLQIVDRVKVAGAELRQVDTIVLQDRPGVCALRTGCLRKQKRFVTTPASSWSSQIKTSRLLICLYQMT